MCFIRPLKTEDMEKMQFSEVEKNLPSGTPAKIRTLDSSGNSILSTISEVAKSIGAYYLTKTFAPLEEYEVKEVKGCLILAQNASIQHEIGVAILYSNLGGVVLNNVSGVSFLEQNKQAFSIYRKETNGSIYIKNNTETSRVIYVRLISII